MIDPPSGIARSARRLRILTIGGMAFLAIAFTTSAVTLIMDADLPGLSVQTGELSPVPAAIMIALTGLLLGLALLRLVSMLRDVERGVTFPAGALRGCARHLFLTVLASIFGPPVLKLVWGERGAMLTLDSGQILMLLITGLLFLVARLLDEARAIADDASQIV